nr:unnamed protein product [Digitaria exilis]
MEAQNGGGGAPVMLNVYDLTPMNNYLYWFGLGIFHSGVEVHGMEYGFGAHEFPTSGVFEVEPKSCPGFVYRRSVWMGTTDTSRAEFRSFVENLAGKYNGNTYNLISKNCNHFTDDISNPFFMSGLWTFLGSFFNYLLPESIQASTVRHVPTYPAFSGELKPEFQMW